MSERGKGHVDLCLCTHDVLVQLFNHYQCVWLCLCLSVCGGGGFGKGLWFERVCWMLSYGQLSGMPADVTQWEQVSVSLPCPCNCLLVFECAGQAQAFSSVRVFVCEVMHGPCGCALARMCGVCVLVECVNTQVCQPPERNHTRAHRSASLSITHVASPHRAGPVVHCAPGGALRRGCSKCGARSP